jgi:hypothetical protein
MRHAIALPVKVLTAKLFLSCADKSITFYLVNSAVHINIYDSHEQAVVCAFTCPLFLLWVSGSLSTRIGGVVPVWTLVLPLDALLAVAVALTTHK